MKNSRSCDNDENNHDETIVEDSLSVEEELLIKKLDTIKLAVKQFINGKKKSIDKNSLVSEMIKNSPLIEINFDQNRKLIIEYVTKWYKHYFIRKLPIIVELDYDELRRKFDGRLFDCFCTLFDLWNDKPFVLDILSTHCSFIEYVSEELTGDPLVIFTALKSIEKDDEIYENQTLVLDCVNEELKNDREFNKKLAEFNGGLFYEFASKKMKQDREIISIAVKSDGKIFANLDETFKKDKEITMIAANNFGFALKYADEKLKDDRDVVMCAVKHYGKALEYASQRLRQDEEIIMNTKR